MVEPTGHCPYLGLKQNRAIRFASPTPEHRCYVSGEPIEIPVDQASFCLSQGHVHCPLYMGLSVPTTSEVAPAVVGSALVVPRRGIRGWFATLSRRDRIIYAIMLAMLALIVAIYVLAGLQTFFARSAALGLGESPSAIPPTPQPALGLVTSVATSVATAVSPTPTNLPTSTPSPRPTGEPTQARLIVLPTQAVLSPTAGSPTAGASISVTGTISTATPRATSAPPARQSAISTTSVLPPTQAPSPQATQAPAPQPTQAPPPPPQPTQAPPVSTSTQILTLYFADATGRLYVPVQRAATVENNQVARAAVRELIAGPRNGLGRLLLPNVKLLDLQISGGTATVNFDRGPTGAGDDRGLYSIVLTLTHFPTIQRVQFQVNGQNSGGPIARPTVNPINPDNLPNDVSQTEFLPLYFVAADGRHDIRLIRMVPKTQQVAAATVRALLEGPDGYGFAVQRVIPVGTELRGIRLENGTIIVDFTQPFAGASNRAAAVRTVVESLTTLKTVGGVLFLVEGRSLGEQWGGDYGKVFGRVVINPE